MLGYRFLIVFFVVIETLSAANDLQVSYEVLRPGKSPLRIPVTFGQKYDVDLPSCGPTVGTLCERTFVLKNTVNAGNSAFRIKVTALSVSGNFDIESTGVLNTLIAPQAELKFKVKFRQGSTGNIYKGELRITSDMWCTTAGVCDIKGAVGTIPVSIVHWKAMAAMVSPSPSPSGVPARASVVDEITSLGLAKNIKSFVELKSKLTLFPAEKALFAALKARAAVAHQTSSDIFGKNFKTTVIDSPEVSETTIQWLKDFILAYNRADLSLGARWLMYCLTETTANAGQAFLESSCKGTTSTGAAFAYGRFIPAANGKPAAWRNLNQDSEGLTVFAKDIIDSLAGDSDAKARALLLVALVQIPVAQSYLRFYLQKALSFDLASQTSKLNPLGRMALRTSLLHTFLMCRPALQDVMVIVNPLLEKLDDPMAKAPLFDLVLKSYPEITLRNW